MAAFELAKLLHSVGYNVLQQSIEFELSFRGKSSAIVLNIAGQSKVSFSLFIRLIILNTVLLWIATTKDLDFENKI